MSSVQCSKVVTVFVPHGPVAFEVTDMLKLPMGAKVTLLSTWSLPFGLRYVFAVDCSEASLPSQVIVKEDGILPEEMFRPVVWRFL